MAILSGLSLISFNPDDPSLNISKNPLFDARPANFIGFAGAYTADMFFQLWGYSAFLIPIFLGIYAFYWLASWPVQSFGIRLSGMILMLFTLSVSFSLAPSFPLVRGYLPAGGLFGIAFGDALETSLNPAGTVIVLTALFFISLFLSTTFSFTWAAGLLKSRFRFVSMVSERRAERKAARLREKALRESGPTKEKTPKSQTIMTEKAELKEIEEPGEVLSPIRKPKTSQPA